MGAQVLAHAAKERAEVTRRRREREAAEFVAQPSLYACVRHLADACLLPLATGHCAACKKRLLPSDPRKLPKVPKAMEVRTPPSAAATPCCPHTMPYPPPALRALRTRCICPRAACSGSCGASASLQRSAGSRADAARLCRSVKRLRLAGHQGVLRPLLPLQVCGDVPERAALREGLPHVRHGHRAPLVDDRRAGVGGALGCPAGEEEGAG